MTKPIRTIKKRGHRGSGLMESVMAAIILVPIALALLDLTVMVIANSMNDTAAKNAARAAANQSTGDAAIAAAELTLKTFQASTLVKSLKINDFDYPPGGKGSISLTTVMEVKLPVPFPGFAGYTFTAKDLEPVVGTKVEE